MHSIQFSSHYHKISFLLILSYFYIKETREVTVHEKMKFVTAKVRAKMTASVQGNIPEGQEIFNRVFTGGLSRETSELDLKTLLLII